MDQKNQENQGNQGNQISRVDMYHVRIPLEKPFYPSWIPGYPATDNRFDLIRITTRDGIEGYSAAPAIASERQGLGNLIAPYLLGHDATDIDLMQIGRASCRERV